jgi:predicted enzyme related to lactoylglutathione lyase
MSLTSFDLITIDTPRTDFLGGFYAQLLGLHESEREDVDRWIVFSDSAGVRRLGFQRGAHKSGCLHLDFSCEVEDFEAERTRILSLGASETREPRIESYGRIANFQDPDGNLFDLCAYNK